MLLFDGPLDNLDLLRDSRELLLEQTVEFVEASPGSALDETDEDSPHRLVVKPFIAIEDQHLPTEGLSQSFHTLCLSSSGRSVWVATVPHLHPQHEGQIALVSERGVDELGSVALVLEGVVEEGISHADLGELGARLDGVLQLFLPHPVARVLARHYALVPKELVDDVDVVNDVQDERLDFREEEAVSLVVEGGVALELLL